MPDVPHRRGVLRAAGVGFSAIGITSIQLATAAAASFIAVVANAPAQAALYSASGAAVTTATGATTSVTVRAFSRDTGAVSCLPVTEANNNGLGRGQGIACDDTSPSPRRGSRVVVDRG